MDPKRFVAGPFEAPRREPGNRWAFWYYQPSPLPRSLDLTGATVLALSEADNALGRLAGLSRLLKHPDILLGPQVTREAVASSRIEGTQTSLMEVLQAEATPEVTDSQDVDEVQRYVAATHLAHDLIRSLPITQRMIKQVHRELLSGVRGADRLPGELRRSPVWVGSPTDNPDTAAYVPPLPEEVPGLLADWELFVNQPPRLPALIRFALAHYQFETIHPFLDGNGRMGRLLIGLQLVHERLLDAPILYLSGYLEAHRREYYDRLQAVHERGEIQEWLQFFLAAVKSQAEETQERVSLLVELRDRYLAEAAGSRSNLVNLIPLMFENPFITVGRVEKSLGLTNQGARSLVRTAEGRGWLASHVSQGRGGRRYWYAREVYLAIEGAPA